MKKVYTATLRGRGRVKVFASGEDEAKKAAFAAYTFNGSMWYPNPPVDDVVVKVEVDAEQVMDSPLAQPSVQIEGYEAPAAEEILMDQFRLKCSGKRKEKEKEGA